MVPSGTGTAEIGASLGPPLPAGGPTNPRGGWGELFRSRRFLLLTASGACAGAGYAVYSVSVLFLAYGLTGNLAVAGAVLVVEYGVYAASFLFAPLVDRARDKRSLLLICFPIQAAASGLLAITLRTGTLSVPILLGLVFVLSVTWDVVWAIFNIAPAIVLPRRQLFLADSVGGFVSMGGQLGGYAGGGALLLFTGPSGGAAAYAVLLLAAFGFALPLSLAIERPPTTAFWSTFTQGWALFRGEAGRALRALSALEVGVGFFGAVPPLLITAIAYQRFSDPAAVYGPLVTAYAVGGSVAGILIGHLNPRGRVGWIFGLAPLAAGLALLGLVAPTVPALAVAVLLTGAGAALTVRANAKNTWFQGNYPHELLGRLISNLYLFTGVASTVAVGLVGGLSPHVGLPELLALDGLGLSAMGLFALASGRLRRLGF